MLRTNWLGTEFEHRAIDDSQIDGVKKIDKRSLIRYCWAQLVEIGFD